MQNEWIEVSIDKGKFCSLVQLFRENAVFAIFHTLGTVWLGTVWYGYHFFSRHVEQVIRKLLYSRHIIHMVWREGFFCYWPPIPRLHPTFAANFGFLKLTFLKFGHSLFFKTCAISFLPLIKSIVYYYFVAPNTVEVEIFASLRVI